MNKKIFSLTCAISCSFIWGTAFVAQDMGMDHIGPFTFTTVRLFLGFLTLLPFMLLKWQPLQKINLKGLKYFSLSSLSIDLRKWYYLKSYKFRLGIGSNYFKERTYTNTDVLPAVIKGQINYLGFDFSLPLGTFNIGLENQISKSMIISTVFVQKEIF